LLFRSAKNPAGARRASVHAVCFGCRVGRCQLAWRGELYGVSWVCQARPRCLRIAAAPSATELPRLSGGYNQDSSVAEASPRLWHHRRREGDMPFRIRRDLAGPTRPFDAPIIVQHHAAREFRRSGFICHVHLCFGRKIKVFDGLRRPIRDRAPRGIKGHFGGCGWRRKIARSANGFGRLRKRRA
jgi:hypothetical protein